MWDRECQARTPRDNPVILPMVPVAFPVPSYASDAFHDETALLVRGVRPRARAAAAIRTGPIVMLQVDNEGALYFRDGAVRSGLPPRRDRASFARSCARSTRASKALREAWNDAGDHVRDRRRRRVRFDAKEAERARAPPRLDGVPRAPARGGHGSLRQGARERRARRRCPTMHNFPLGEAATPLNASRMARGRRPRSGSTTTTRPIRSIT